MAKIHKNYYLRLFNVFLLVALVFLHVKNIEQVNQYNGICVDTIQRVQLSLGSVAIILIVRIASQCDTNKKLGQLRLSEVFGIRRCVTQPCTKEVKVHDGMNKAIQDGEDHAARGVFGVNKRPH